MLCSCLAYASPQGGELVHGEVVITQSTTATHIDQSSSKAIINWQDFSITNNESVYFSQPSQSSIVLNRVVGDNLSVINGQLGANGTVFLVNQNGVVFGQDAQVNVGGLLVSTFDIGNDDFLAGRFDFNTLGASDGVIVNDGQITIAEHGLAAFVAPHVTNNGLISAHLSRVALGATQSGFSLDLYGDNLIRFALSDEMSARLNLADGTDVTVNGQIVADGGSVFITAQTAREVVSSIITVGGAVQANTIGMDDGKIVLSADHLQIDGVIQSGGVVELQSQSLALQGAVQVENGGQINIDTDYFYLDGAVDASNVSGQGGNIAINTNRFDGMAGGLLNVDGVTGGHIYLEGQGMVAFSSEASAQGTEAGGLIEITGDSVILLNAEVNVSGGKTGGVVHLGGGWQGSGALPQARETIIGVGSELLANGASGGEVVVWSTESTEHYGLLQASDGGRIELSSKGQLVLNGGLEAGLGGEVLLDPKNLIITDTPPDSIAMALKVAHHTQNGLTQPSLSDGDWFGRSVALDGDNLAVGSELDDTGGTNYGAVHLFTGVNTTLTWQKKIASNTGAIDMLTIVGDDRFGVSVALDGDHLAVGAHLDDTNADDGFWFWGEDDENLGAVYLFSGVLSADADPDFTDLTYRRKIAKDVGITDMPTLGDEYQFGVSVSLDGDSLAVGAHNFDSGAGQVYLFNGLSSANYTGVAFQESITSGAGAAGMPALAAGDNFGISVSLDGNLLVVGARGDEATNRGAVYLFNGVTDVLDFADLNYVKKLDSATVGLGLSDNDEFGMSVALDNGRLAVGAYLDDTATVADGGAVYLFSNVGADYSLLKLYEKLDADSVGLSNGDQFGVSVALDGDRLAVGAYKDDTGGGGGSERGAVYLYTGMETVGGISVDDAKFAVNPGDNSYITPLTITALLNAGTSVELQASNNLTVLSNILAANASGIGGHLIFQAGNSVLLSANIDTDDGDLSITANEIAAEGVVDGDRDNGDANITMDGGTSITAGMGTVTITLADGAGNTNRGIGAISLGSVNATNLTINNTNLGSSVVDTAASIITGTTDLNAVGATVTLDYTDNDFNVVTVDGATVTLVDTNGLNLGASNITGDFTVDVGGVLIDSGALVVAGTTDINGVGQDITLDHAGNDFDTDDSGDALTVDGAVVKIVDVDGLNIGTANVTTLVAESDGDLTLSGVVTATGTLGDGNSTAIVFATDGNFSETGTGDLDTGAGRFIIYSANPSSDSLIDLTATPWYNSTYNSGDPTAVAGTGDRFAYTQTANLLVTADAQSRDYGAANPVFSQTVSGYVNSDNSDILIGSAGAANSTADGDTNVGSVVITASIGTLSTDRNYNISIVNGVLSIDAVPLSITAINDSKTYDGLGFSGGNGVIYSAFVNGETAAVLGGALAYGGSAQNVVDAGSYTITPTGLTSGNYAIGFVDGSLAVSQRPISFSANYATKMAVSVDPPLSVMMIGGSLATTDTQSEVTGLVGRTPGESVGYYDILLSSGAKTSNYTISFNQTNQAFQIISTIGDTPDEHNWEPVPPQLPPDEDENDALPFVPDPDVGEFPDSIPQPDVILPEVTDPITPPVEPVVIIPEISEETQVETLEDVSEPVEPAPENEAVQTEPLAPEPVAEVVPEVNPLDEKHVSMSEAIGAFVDFEADGTVTLEYSTGEKITGIAMVDTSIGLEDQTLVITRYNPAQGKSVRFATTVSSVFLNDGVPTFKGGFVIADEGDGLTVIPFGWADKSHGTPSSPLQKISFSVSGRDGGIITFDVFISENDLLINPRNKVATVLTIASPQLVLGLAIVEIQKQLDVSLDDIEAVFFNMTLY